MDDTMSISNNEGNDTRKYEGICVTNVKIYEEEVFQSSLYWVQSLHYLLG